MRASCIEKRILMSIEIKYQCRSTEWAKIPEILKSVGYEKIGFRKMKTGMAYFINRDNMAERGFTE
jgi:hypothetical protein